MPSHFVHLAVHSEYSLANGIVRLPDLIKQAVELEMPAVALTDLNNLYGLVKFNAQCLRNGVKPLFGVDVWVHNEDKVDEPFPLKLLVQNDEGYKNACVLISKSYQIGQDNDKPCVRKEWIYAHNTGLIALSSGMKGELGQALLSETPGETTKVLSEYRALFPDRFYIELQRTSKQYQEEYIGRALEAASRFQIPVVATNDVHFMKESDYDSHEARICIHQGRTVTDSRRVKEFTPQQYFRSADEMIELFKDIPTAIENTVEIAKRCTFELTTGINYLPDFPIPEGETDASHLRNETIRGMDRIKLRLSEENLAKWPEYLDRMDFELGIIDQMGFPGYFLIVADFIQWSKDNDIPVGPGRGSGAGSIVAYALGITDLDPLEYGLLFERFLNPERVSMPDFDVDFCIEGRERVIQYVSEKYGKEKVSQIITFGTMAAKAVVRDVGRVLSMPYGFVDSIAKLIPFDIGITLTEAMEKEEELRRRYETEDEVTQLIDLALSLEGCSRNVGKHAGGVVIGKSDLTDYNPLYCESNGASIVSQYDKDDLETVGLVKFDFLGLRTLTIVNEAIRSVNRKRLKNNLEAIDINELSTDDPKVYEYLSKGETTALFQLESPGMRAVIRDLEPDAFEEIIALLALYRPGPLGAGMEKTFCNRKHGREKLTYDHPILEPILNETYGGILYQEQVMQISQYMAGYSLGGADILRRAMGKKKVEEMNKQRALFLKGAQEREIDEAVATKVFNDMEYFAQYGFNKSHSAAYAVVTYQTAWLKTYYASDFLAACMSEEMINTDKVVILLNEAEKMGLTVMPPNINKCSFRFISVDDKTIIYGLGAVKGLGEAVIEHLIEIREQGGVYKNLFDLCQRIDVKKVNKRAFEALIKAGAFDDFGEHRASLMASIPVAMEAASQRAKSAEVGQNELFAVAAPQETVNELKHVDAWMKNDLLAFEKDTLGLYLSGHPIDIYLSELRQVASTELVDQTLTGNSKDVTLAGLIVAISHKPTKSGKKRVFVTLDDKSARMEVTFWEEQFERSREALIKDQVVIIKGQMKKGFNDDINVTGNEVYDLASIRQHLAKSLQLTLHASQVNPQFISELKHVLIGADNSKVGNCQVNISYESDSGVVDLNSSGSIRIIPNQNVLDSLVKLLGEENYSLNY